MAKSKSPLDKKTAKERILGLADRIRERLPNIPIAEIDITDKELITIVSLMLLAGFKGYEVSQFLYNRAEGMWDGARDMDVGAGIRPMRALLPVEFHDFIPNPKFTEGVHYTIEEVPHPEFGYNIWELSRQFPKEETMLVEIDPPEDLQAVLKSWEAEWAEFLNIMLMLGTPAAITIGVPLMNTVIKAVPEYIKGIGEIVPG